MNGFYMGYNASKVPLSDLKALADQLTAMGLYEAGYRTLRLGDRSAESDDVLGGMIWQLYMKGFEVDITRPVEKADKHLGAVMLTFVEEDPQKAAMAVQNARKAGVKRVCLKVKESDLAWAAQIADVVELDTVEPNDDFYHITRSYMDSCFPDQVEIEHSQANKRRTMLKESVRYQLGCLPLKFDDERNFAILGAWSMLGSPLVLDGPLDMLSHGTLAALKIAEINEIATQGVGGVAHYYDPWHILLGKNRDENCKWLMILNLCHGDAFTSLTADGLGWSDHMCIADVRTGALLAQKVKCFSSFVETSDHPLSSCCKLLRVTKIV